MNVAAGVVPVSEMQHQGIQINAYDDDYDDEESHQDGYSALLNGGQDTPRPSIDLLRPPEEDARSVNL